MALQKRFEFTFPREAEVVQAHYANPDYFHAMAGVVGGNNISIRRRHSGESDMEIEIEMSLVPLLPLPGFARKLIGSAIGVRQHVAWNQKDLMGRMEVSSAQIPYEGESRFRIEPLPDGCKVVSEWDIRIKLPLIGAALERIAAEEIRLRLKAELEAVDQLMTL